MEVSNSRHIYEYKKVFKKSKIKGIVKNIIFEIYADWEIMIFILVMMLIDP